MKGIEMLQLGMLAICLAGMMACTPSKGDDFMNDFPGDFPGEMPGGGGAGTSSNDGTLPGFDATIAAWDGEMADDAALDVVGSNADFYHEANEFTSTITVTYNGTSASVVSSNDQILHHTSGAYVTLDMKTHSVSGVQIIVKGKSEDGGLKIYGEKKFKLTLDGVELTSKKGPAINSQCKKRMFVHLNKGNTNRLTDVATYSDDAYYLDASADEDRKGCFFSEGNLVFSGTGVLVVAGKYKHAIVTDGYFWMRPGVTLVVTEAAKNGIHVKGDEDDQIGVSIQGGLVYARIAASAGKGIKSDMDVEITGGKLLLNTSGEAIYESDEQDTSSAACIKTDGSIVVSGGIHTLKSTGTGGKGFNADGNLVISGGETTITTTGGKYTYSEDLTSSPKGAKADGDITISGGKLNISVTGKSDGSEGLESKANLTISAGEVYVYAYDDAINAATDISISGGRVYAYACNNDGIDSNGTMTVSGGVVIATGTGGAESGIDVDNSNDFKINGGTVLAMGGTLMANPSSASSQRCVVYNGCSGAKDKMLAVLDSSSKPILAFKLVRTVSNASFLFSCPEIEMGKSYEIALSGTLSGYKDSWNGWFDGGTWTGGTELTSFTSSNVVTVIGGSSGGPGGPGGTGGGPGGW